MNKQITSADRKAAYIAKTGHNLSFLKVTFEGQEVLVMNNHLCDLEAGKNLPVDLTGEQIAALPLAQEDTLDNRLDNLAFTAVQKHIPTNLVIMTAMAICELVGLDIKSKEFDTAVQSMPERIAAQDGAELYMLHSLLGELAK